MHQPVVQTPVAPFDGPNRVQCAFSDLLATAQGGEFVSRETCGGQESFVEEREHGGDFHVLVVYAQELTFDIGEYTLSRPGLHHHA